ncbi:MAG: type II toxin-antitoxin system VapC family toxin [Fimbriimonadales bacterium]
MIVETSAIVSMIKEESGSDALLASLKDSTEAKLMSAASYLEAAILIDRLDEPVLSNRLDDLIKSLRIQIVPVTQAQAIIARKACGEFGKGSGHKAALNFGDCFAYALAKDTGEGILFVGNDFSHTDLFPTPY